jgi:Protein of unknown function (DUF2934)
VTFLTRSIPAEAIRQRAYRIWQREGKPQGKSLEHWQRAERELREDTPHAGLYARQETIYFWDYHG